MSFFLYKEHAMGDSVWTIAPCRDKAEYSIETHKLFKLSEINKKLKKHWQLLPLMIRYHLSLMTEENSSGSPDEDAEAERSEDYRKNFRTAVKTALKQDVEKQKKRCWQQQSDVIIYIGCRSKRTAWNARENSKKGEKSSWQMKNSLIEYQSCRLKRAENLDNWTIDNNPWKFL